MEGIREKAPSRGGRACGVESGLHTKRPIRPAKIRQIRCIYGLCWFRKRGVRSLASRQPSPHIFLLYQHSDFFFSHSHRRNVSHTAPMPQYSCAPPELSGTFTTRASVSENPVPVLLSTSFIVENVEQTCPSRTFQENLLEYVPKGTESLSPATGAFGRFWTMQPYQLMQRMCAAP